MFLVEIRVQRPPVDDARGQHAAVLAAAVLLQRGALAPGTQHGVRRCLVEGQVGRVLQRGCIEPDGGKDATHRVEVPRCAVVAGAHEGQQIGGGRSKPLRTMATAWSGLFDERG